MFFYGLLACLRTISRFNRILILEATRLIFKNNLEGLNKVQVDCLEILQAHLQIDGRQGYKGYIVDRAFLKLLKDTSKHEHVIIESNNKGKWVIAVKKGLVLQQACFEIEL